MSLPLWANEPSRLELDKLATSPGWLSLYQYRARGTDSYLSDVLSSKFFFASNGRTSPQAELKAALKAFQNPKTLWGYLQKPAACAYPARRDFLEKKLNLSFPVVECPDLSEWLARIGAKSAHIGFASAYLGNPASIMGHSFLRLSPTALKKMDKTTEAIELLSYSVSFSAEPDPRDDRLSYMLKGVSGGYPGYYQIQPFYTTRGIYNSSENRDLWEQPLNLSPREVSFLTKHVWELLFNARFAYYFADENCSYRILTLLQAVRADLNLRPREYIVLPAETIRVLMEKGLAHSNSHYFASIETKFLNKWQVLTDEQKRLYDKARKDIHFVKRLNDPHVLDVLNDYWAIQNYQAKTKLRKRERELMEATLRQQAELTVPAIATLTLKPDASSEAVIKSSFDHRVVPPYKSHRPGWARVSLQQERGWQESFKSIGFETQYGAHSSWQSEQGYFPHSTLEFARLSLALSSGTGEITKWNILVAELQSIASARSFSRYGKPSWFLNLNLGTACSACPVLPEESSVPRLATKAGVGFTTEWRQNAVSLLALSYARKSLAKQGLVPLIPGIALKVKLILHSRLRVLGTAEWLWPQGSLLNLATLALHWSPSLDRSSYLRWQRQEGAANESRRDLVELGFTQAL